MHRRTNKMNKTIEINGNYYSLNFLEKDIDAEFIKWHNFTMDNMFNANDFYIVQIVQEKDNVSQYGAQYMTSIGVLNTD